MCDSLGWQTQKRIVPLNIRALLGLDGDDGKETGNDYNGLYMV